MSCYECAQVLITLMILKCILVRCMTLREMLDLSAILEEKSLDEKSTEDTEDSLRKEGSTDDEENADWEASGKFEGDILLNRHQRRAIIADVAGLQRNGDPLFSHRWPNRQLVYHIAPGQFDWMQENAIMEAMELISSKSCITFRPWKRGDSDVVKITGEGKGCWSYLGRKGGSQILNLSASTTVGKGCFRHGTIVHELLHALGFSHTHSAPDRDNYIKIIWENVAEEQWTSFLRYRTLDYGVPYDYNSILHYGKKSFSKNGHETIVPIGGPRQIGQRKRLSEGDVIKLNRMYCQGYGARYTTIDTSSVEVSTEATKLHFKITTF